MSIELLLSLFIQYGYWIVFAGILLDNAGLPLPGELLLLTFGALVRTGDLDWGPGLLAASAAAISGDSVGYWLGRLTGDRVLRTYCRLTLGSGKCVRKAVSYYHHHGKAAVIFGRFVMGMRAFLSPLAGSAGMPFAQFLLFDSLGALIWSGLFILLGYSFGWRLERVHEGYRDGSMMLVTALGVGFAVYLLMKLARRWRHGPGFLRERTIARVRKALRPPSGTGFPALISMPCEMGLVEPNGTGQTDRGLIPSDDVPCRDTQARRNPGEGPRPPEAREKEAT